MKAMNLRFISLTGVLVLVASATVFPSAVTAEPDSSAKPSDYETPADTFNRAFFKNDPNFFRNQSVGRQFDLIFGVGNSFPENEIRRDGELVDTLYQDTLKQQGSSGPIIRTPDLPNPYNTTLLESPALNPNNR